MYAGKWNVKETRNFTSEEQSRVSRIEVVNSEYGKSACFFMANGQRGYIPLDKDSELMTPIGKELSFSSIEIVTLERMGDADIKRIKVK